MIERLLYTVISDGIADYLRTPSKIERLLRRRGLTTTEAVALRDVFQRFTPTVIHNYPRADSAFPLYAIVLGDEGESQQFLNTGGALLDEEMVADVVGQGLEGSFLRTSVFEMKYQILAVSDQRGGPDMTLAYYQILRDILTRALTELKEHGILSSKFSGGDVHPSMLHLPASLFIRQLIVVVQAEQATIEENLEHVRSLTGMHVDDGSTITALGGARAHVTPYSPPDPIEETE